MKRQAVSLFLQVDNTSFSKYYRIGVLGQITSGMAIVSSVTSSTSMTSSTSVTSMTSSTSILGNSSKENKNFTM